MNYLKIYKMIVKLQILGILLLICLVYYIFDIKKFRTRMLKKKENKMTKK